MLSRFTHKVNLKRNVYVVYNSLLFDPIVMNTQEVKALFAGDLKRFKKEDIDVLYKRGILVHRTAQDDKALSDMIKMVQKQVYNKVNLLYVIPTSICNLACKYCFIGELKIGRAHV